MFVGRFELKAKEVIFVLELLDLASIGVVITDWIIGDVRGLGRVVERAYVLVNETVGRRETGDLGLKEHSP